MTVTTAHAAAAGRLTRVTVSGPRHRIDLVLPSEEPIAVLLPELVPMVGHTPSEDPRAYQVSTLDGSVLGPNANLRGAGIQDGTLLRLDPLTDAPPAAILHDVSDEVADDLSQRRGRWGDVSRRWTATGTVAAAAMLAAVLAGLALPAVLLGVIGVAVLLLGTTVAAWGLRDVGVAVLLGGSLILMVGTSLWPMDWSAHWALGILEAGMTVLALGTATGKQRAGLFGAGAAVLLLGLWTALFMFGLPAVRVSAVMAVVSVGALGVLPRLAMQMSGLTKLDDRHSQDAPVSRVTAASAVDSAHRGLALASVATAISGGIAGWLLAQGDSGWSVAMACLVAIAILLRLRAFPLIVEVVGMVAGALAIVTGLIIHWTLVSPQQWWGGTAAAVAIAALGIAVLGYDAPPHMRARARQVADRAEGIAIVVLVPVAVGVFGVYTRLLGTF